MKKKTPSASSSAQLSAELRFLVACCQAEPTPGDINLIGDYLSQPTNHQSLITTASCHGVLPLVYKTLLALNADTSAMKIKGGNTNAPSGNALGVHESLDLLLADLKTAYMSIVQRNMLITGELIRMMELLRENGIEALAFKGPALARLAYGDITLRQFGDLDILIHRQDFRWLARQMESKGYAPAFPIASFKGDRVMFDMNNDCPFYDYHRRLSVEIHWDFFRKLALPTAKFSPWEQTTNVIINGMEIPTLRHETHLLYHSLHGSKHIWERLSWIVDIDRFIRNVPDVDWEFIVAKANALGALRMFLFGPALARHFFDTPLPEKIVDLCEKADFDDLITFVTSEFNRPEPTPEDSLAKLKKVIALRDSLYFKSLTLLEFLFRPGINERRTIVLPDALFWLYWPLRPLGMSWRFLLCRVLKLCAKNPKA